MNPFVTQAFTHRTFFSRLHHFMIASDAFIVTPGGIVPRAAALQLPYRRKGLVVVTRVIRRDEATYRRL